MTKPNERERPGFLGQLLALLTPQEKRRGALVFVLMLGLALLETAGVASVMPFLAVLGSPELVHTNAQLAWLYERGGFESVDAFLFALGVGAFVLVVISSAFRVLKTYAVNRYVRVREYSLSSRLLQVYLRQPYTFFLNRNSADLSKRMLSETTEFTKLALRPLLELISYSLVAFLLVCFLFVVDPVVAVLVTLVVGGLYGAVYLGVRSLLQRMGRHRISMNRLRFQSAGEAFGGIKDLKVLGREEAYLGRFRKAAARYARYQYLNATIGATPKYLIEATAFGGILALSLFLMATRDNLGSVLPLLGVYAFAGYRLIPATQHIFKSASALRFGAPVVEDLYEDLVVAPTAPSPVGRADPISLRHGITFRRVSYCYPGAARDSLEDIDIHIPAMSSVGLIGQTGAGKTTAVDLLLGLLQPTRGEVLVDGVPLQEIHIGRWQRALGYVPQQIYIADTSVMGNIALGVPEAEVDRASVERAAKVARIHQFIESQLPEGYETKVGERGVRLSGGQLQRIGIARALYHDPSVLVFDEATSALDTATEESIMEAVESLSGEKTIVMIAHRLSTVAGCDHIVVLRDGKVDRVEHYEDVIADGPAPSSIVGS